jgi:hypothetical protein
VTGPGGGGDRPPPTGRWFNEEDLELEGQPLARGRSRSPTRGSYLAASAAVHVTVQQWQWHVGAQRPRCRRDHHHDGGMT